jgi:hypothetical protein
MKWSLPLRALRLDKKFFGLVISSPINPKEFHGYQGSQNRRLHCKIGGIRQTNPEAPAQNRPRGLPGSGGDHEVVDAHFDYKGVMCGMAAFKPPSHRREYLEWVTEAKREETSAQRLATSIEWLGEGKARNWKYMPAKKSKN